MQEARARHAWVTAAAKSNHTALPTEDELQIWEHYSVYRLVQTELSEMASAIDDIGAALRSDLHCAVPQERAEVGSRCTELTEVRGSCVSVGTQGGYVCFSQLLRVCFNSGTTGDQRNLVQRFVESADRTVKLVKDADAMGTGSDVRVGNNVLAVFHHVGVLFCVGQVRQLVSSTKAYGKTDIFVRLGNRHICCDAVSSMGAG